MEDLEGDIKRFKESMERFLNAVRDNALTHPPAPLYKVPDSVLTEIADKDKLIDRLQQENERLKVLLDHYRENHRLIRSMFSDAESEEK